MQRLKTSCNLDDFSELNEAARAMSKVFMPKRASVAGVSKFLGVDEAVKKESGLTNEEKEKNKKNKLVTRIRRGRYSRLWICCRRFRLQLAMVPSSSSPLRRRGKQQRVMQRRRRDEMRLLLAKGIVHNAAVYMASAQLALTLQQ